VLQSWWTIVRHTDRTWSVENTWEVMTDCVIMHNMIIDDERDECLLDQGWQF
jgi:hypothetical protein